MIADGAVLTAHYGAASIVSAALADDAIRDKEAATGVLLVECAAVLKSQGKTLWDYLDEIYRTYGYFQQVLPFGEGSSHLCRL